MVRAVIALGLGAALGYAAGCGSSASFVCAADGECSLAGTPGICADGYCAYPDDACGSGYAYPVSSPSGKGGQCVDGVAEEGAGTGDGDGWATGAMEAEGSTASVDDADADGSTGRPDDGVDGDTMGTSAGESGKATTDGPGTTTATTGNPACGDEVGDSEAVADLIESCEGAGAENVLDGDDVDWFAMGGGNGCPGEPYIAHFTEGGEGAEICLFAGCSAGDPSMMCSDGTPTTVGTLQGCCGDANVPPLGVGTCGGMMASPVELYVRITANPNDAVDCADYAFMVGVANG